MSRPRPAWRPPPREGVNASCVAVPHAAVAHWPSVLAFLSQRLPVISPEDWRQRLLRGEVLDASGQALRPHSACEPERLIWYWRQVDDEAELPVEVTVLHQDETLVVADKPHFMTISPKGRHARETVLARLQRQLGLETLTPIHRLDRETAGVVLFSVRPEDRAAYQAMFAQRQVRKRYEAVAPWRADLSWPLTRASRIVPGAGPMQMVEAEGEANALTHIHCLAVAPAARTGLPPLALYQLEPLTGRTHQLRVHMNALGLPIQGDRIYPVLLPVDAPGQLPDFSQALQLLARHIAFMDPVTGQAREFSSRRQLAWPPEADPLSQKLAGCDAA